MIAFLGQAGQREPKPKVVDVYPPKGGTPAALRAVIRRIGTPSAKAPREPQAVPTAARNDDILLVNPLRWERDAGSQTCVATLWAASNPGGWPNDARAAGGGGGAAAIGK